MEKSSIKVRRGETIISSFFFFPSKKLPFFFAFHDILWEAHPLCLSKWHNYPLFVIYLLSLLVPHFLLNWTKYIFIPPSKFKFASLILFANTNWGGPLISLFQAFLITSEAVSSYVPSLWAIIFPLWCQEQLDCCPRQLQGGF